MDRELRQRLEAFLRPLYMDVDGASRFSEVERVAAIARKLHTPASEADARAFELLLLFHRLGKWLDKVGNLSRTKLVIGSVSEAELHQVAASIRRLDEPVSDAEKAVAAAMLIDDAGVRGLTERFQRARREGSSLMDVVRNAVADVSVPEWMPERGEVWLHARRESRREFCKRLLEEIELDDLA